MSEVVGRAGFRVTHEYRVSKQGAILDEMMRERIPGASERWAESNRSIVLEDEKLNIALVNDGKGGFDLCKDPKEVLAYGQKRLAKLSHPIKAPKLDPKTGEEKGGTTTSSMFVIHLPKTLCEEVKDFYPVYDDDGNDTGLKRSRWVARDKNAAIRYFKDVLRYMAQEVIPGGFDAILGADIQFSESTPHIQILADTFAPDPKHPGQLRSEFSRAYTSHRDVRDEKGKQVSGKAKLRRYQEGFRERMVELGWPVERDVDQLRHDKTATKAVYGALKDKERALAEQEQKLAADLAAAHDVIESEIKARVDELADERKNLDTERAAVELERQQLQKDKEKALEDARTQGYADGFKEARSEGYAKGFEEGRSEVDALKEQVSEQLDHAKAIVAVIEKRNVSLPLAHSRETFRIATQVFADRLKKKGVQPDIVDDAKRWADGFRDAPAFDEYVMKPAKEAYENSKKHTQQLRQMINESAQQLDSSKPDLDDGPEFG